MKPLLRVCRGGLSILIFVLVLGHLSFLGRRVARAQMFLTRLIGD